MIIDILNPQRIVIGSIFARCRPWLQEAMEEEIAREALPPAAAACTSCPPRWERASGISPACPRHPGGKEGAMNHLEELLARYPALEVCRADIESALRALIDCYTAGGSSSSAETGAAPRIPTTSWGSS